VKTDRRRTPVGRQLDAGRKEHLEGNAALGFYNDKPDPVEVLRKGFRSAFCTTNAQRLGLTSSFDPFSHPLKCGMPQRIVVTSILPCSTAS
jgi:hypothetical protein